MNGGTYEPCDTGILSGDSALIVGGCTNDIPRWNPYNYSMAGSCPYYVTVSDPTKFERIVRA